MTRTRLFVAFATAIALTACGSDPDSGLMGPKLIPDIPEEPIVFSVAAAHNGSVLMAADGTNRRGSQGARGKVLVWRP